MGTWWVADYAQRGEYVVLLSWIFWVLFSITLHELAHGWAAIWQGDRTPIELDRMTMNPLVQMGPNSLIVFALCGIAWGAMPVNPMRFRDGRKGDIYVSAAGPAMNVALGLICVVLLIIWLKVWPQGSNLYHNVATFLFYGVGLNLILAPFNLLPIPPLDGSHILAGLSYRARELYSHPHAPMIGMFLFVAIFFLSPVGDLLFGFGWMAAALLVDLGGLALGNPSIADVLF